MTQKFETADSDDRAVDVHATEVPPAVREAAIKLMSPGDTLWRCPRAEGRNRWFNFHLQPVVIEWWLVDQPDKLIEAFWEI